LLAFSGGWSSTALLWELRAQGYGVFCLFIDHGQANAGRALAVADQLASRANQRRKAGQEIKLHVVTARGLAQNPQPTNTIEKPRHELQILSLAAAYALGTSEITTLACGLNRESMANGFAPAWANLLGLYSGDKLAFYVPWIDRDSGWIISRAVEQGAPLIDSWSCLSAGKHHCGTCRGCKSRRRGFEAAGLVDYTVYASDTPVILPFGREKKETG
jgi:7-cyano-7-deazaguanine synthase